MKELGLLFVTRNTPVRELIFYKSEGVKIYCCPIKIGFGYFSSEIPCKYANVF